jgi:hypothetical protein
MFQEKINNQGRENLERKLAKKRAHIFNSSISISKRMTWNKRCL